MPAAIHFKDREGFRPVCPFFEVHGTWSVANEVETGPLTVEILERNGYRLSDLTWEVCVANLKPFNMTMDAATRVVGHVSFSASSGGRVSIFGTSPTADGNPLVVHNGAVELGAAQPIKPTNVHPEIRLRFFPPKGVVYGPKGVDLQAHGIRIPDELLVLNSASSWYGWTPQGQDPRGTPGGQYAQDDGGRSLGLLDDTSDGIITCSISSPSRTIKAYSRIVVAPPHFSPDRRPTISIADGLKDRKSRAEVFYAAYYLDLEGVEAEVVDVLERAAEAISAMNVDVVNNRVNVVNNPIIATALGIPQPAEEKRGFGAPRGYLDPLPLTAFANNIHRRLVVPTVLVKTILNRPYLFEKILRPPFPELPFFDRQMPFGLRGSSGLPLSLTHRQYQVLLTWAKKVAILHNRRTQND
jgi:hypothetical protein